MSSFISNNDTENFEDSRRILKSVTDLHLKIIYGAFANFNDAIRLKRALDEHHEKNKDSLSGLRNFNISINRFVNFEAEGEKKCYHSDPSTQLFFIVKSPEDTEWLCEQLKFLVSSKFIMKEISLALMTQSVEENEMEFWSMFNFSMKLPIIPIRIDDFKSFDDRISSIYQTLRLKTNVIRL